MDFFKTYGVSGLGVSGAMYCSTAAATYATLITAYQPGVCLETLKSMPYIEKYISSIPADWSAIPDVLSALLVADLVFPLQLPIIVLLTKRIVDKKTE